MVVRIRELVTLIRDCRIEDKVHVLVNQPRNMTMRKLGRVTLGLTWDGVDTKLVDLTSGLRREYDREAELLEKCRPERIVFIHI